MFCLFYVFICLFVCLCVCLSVCFVILANHCTTASRDMKLKGPFLWSYYAIWHSRKAQFSRYTAQELISKVSLSWFWCCTFELWMIYCISYCCISHYVGIYGVNTHKSTIQWLFHQTIDFATNILHIPNSFVLFVYLFVCFPEKNGRWDRGPQNRPLQGAFDDWLPL